MAGSFNKSRDRDCRRYFTATFFVFFVTLGLCQGAYAHLNDLETTRVNFYFVLLLPVSVAALITLLVQLPVALLIDLMILPKLLREESNQQW